MVAETVNEVLRRPGAGASQVLGWRPEEKRERAL
jgi:hypothetical protein